MIRPQIASVVVRGSILVNNVVAKTEAEDAGHGSIVVPGEKKRTLARLEHVVLHGLEE
jgi:hypothetical protein